MLEVEQRASNTAAFTRPLYAFAAFYVLVSAAMASAQWYFRAPLGGPGVIVFVTYWVQLVILLGAIVLGATRGRYLIWFSTALAALLLLNGVSHQVWFAVFPLAAAVLVLLTIRVRRAYPLGPWQILVLGGLGAGALGSVYFLTMNGMNYATIFLPERMLSGLAWPDSLFQTALSSMIVNYGTLASALDGLARFHYHAFSHLWFGISANGVGLNVVHGYYLAMQIICLPMLLFGLTFATFACTPVRAERNAIPLFIAVPIAMLFVLDRFDFASCMVSESQMVGTFLFLLGLPLLHHIAVGADRYPDRTAMLALAYAILLTTAKVSIGGMWTVPLVYILLRARRLSPRGYCGAAILLALNAYVGVAYAVPNDNVSTTSIGLFDFIKLYPVIAGENLALILAAAAFHLRDVRQGRDPHWNEMLLLALLLAVLPAFLLKMEGGAADYFLNAGAWLAIVTLSGRLISSVKPIHAGRMLATAVVVIAVMVVLTPTKLIGAYRQLKSQRQALYLKTIPEQVAALTHINLFNRDGLTPLKAGMTHSTGAEIGALFAKLDVQPGSDVVVAVSPDFTDFWQMTKFCHAAPFLIPAYFGVPLLNGVPPVSERCELGTYYGYRLYGESSRARKMSDTELCLHADNKGFHNVIILDSQKRARRLACSGLARP